MQVLYESQEWLNLANQSYANTTGESQIENF